MRSTGRFLHKVDAALDSLAVPPGARVLAGCSGGPDSTALVLALGALARRGRIFVAAAYVDHGIRPTAEREAERACAESACAAAGSSLAVLRVEPGLIECEARAARRSLEEVARRHRLRLLRAAAREGGCQLIALGHTADDQAETLLMRFLQGSGVAGLAGIRPRSGNVIRPMLECSRSEVREFLRLHGGRHHDDSSNADQRFLRNAVRCRLLPAVRALFPGHRSALLALSRKMADAADFLSAQLAGRDVWREEGPREFSADAEAFYSLPAALRAESLYRVLDRASDSQARVPYRAIESLLHRRPARLDSRIAGVRVLLAAGRLRVTADVVRPAKRGYFSLVLGPGASGTESDRLPGGFQAALPDRRPLAIRFGAAGVRPPVVVRSPRRGDRLRTAAGSKSLKKLLNQWGVSLHARDDVRVAVDARGALAVTAPPEAAVVAEPAKAEGGSTLAPSTRGERS